MPSRSHLHHEKLQLMWHQAQDQQLSKAQHPSPESQQLNE